MRARQALPGAKLLELTAHIGGNRFQQSLLLDNCYRFVKQTPRARCIRKELDGAALELLTQRTDDGL